MRTHTHEQARKPSRHQQSARVQAADTTELQTLADNHTAQRLSWRETVQRAAESSAGATAPAHHNGLPEPLKSSIEQLGGYSMDDVQVHYGSPQPAQIQAHAYTQGNHIYLAHGQERHLAHEAWHVVQQRRDPIQPTTHIGGVAINDSPKLEREADEMGRRALTTSSTSTPTREPERAQSSATNESTHAPLQAYFATPERPEDRMSDGDQFILVGKKALFAKAEAISDSNEALHDAGALVSLGREGSSVVVPQGTFLRIKLVPDEKNLADSIWERMKEVASPDVWRTYADCYRNSTTVSGMKQGLDQGGVLELEDGAIDLITQTEMSKMGVPLNVAGQARMTLFNHAFRPFRAELHERDAEAHADLIGRLDTYLEGAPNYVEANKVYLAITRSANALTLFNTMFGVNTKVAPRVGLALTQVNDEKLTNYLNDKGQDKWNFHWAGIIMVDGSDYVTLENCAVEMQEVTREEYLAEKDWFDDKTMYALASDKKMDIVNERWYFALHGADAQSFHAENLKDSHSTVSALTLGLSHK